MTRARTKILPSSIAIVAALALVMTSPVRAARDVEVTGSDGLVIITGRVGNVTVKDGGRVRLIDARVKGSVQADGAAAGGVDHIQPARGYSGRSSGTGAGGCHQVRSPANDDRRQV